LAVTLREYQAGDRAKLLSCMEPGAPSMPDHEEMMQHAWTLCDDGTPVACSGVMEFWEGVAEGWLNVSCDALKKHPIRITREIIRHLQVLIKDLGIRRLQCRVRTDFPLGIKFVERLGWKPEGVLEGFAPDGQDCIMYAMMIAR